MNQVKVGKFLAELRHQQHLTQEELGVKLGVTNKTISRWENGVYLPDIEMLQILSQLYDVSINELIAGETIPTEQFMQKAEQNLITALCDSRFTLKEKVLFYKRKWKRDHLLSIACSLIVVIAVFVLGVLLSKAWLSGISIFFGLAGYLYIRNRMMIYVEARAYGQADM